MGLSESVSGRTPRILVVFVLALAVAMAVGQFVTFGLSGALEGLIFVYIAAVLTYGVFRERLESPEVQVAFGLGIGAYGALMYASNGNVLWLGLAAVAAFLVARNLAFLTQ